MRTFILRIYDNLESYLSFSSGDFLIIKIISALFCLWFFVLIIILMKQSKTFEAISEDIKAFRVSKEIDKVKKEWDKILKTFQKGDEASLKIAIIEADKLLDDILKKMGLGGKDMGERLEKITREQMKNIDEIWLAHRIRNKIVHEADFKLTPSETEKVIAIYEETLKSLQAL